MTTSSRRQEGEPQDEAAEARDCRPDADEDGLVLAPSRSVSFSCAADDIHEITPYSEVYGIHPRTFNFGSHMTALPAVMGFVLTPSDDSDTDSFVSCESDEEVFIE